MYISKKIRPGKLIEYISILFSCVIGVWLWLLAPFSPESVQLEFSGVNMTNSVGYFIILLSFLHYAGASMDKKDIRYTMFSMIGSGVLGMLFWEITRRSFHQDPYSLDVFVYSIASHLSVWFMYDSVGQLRYLLYKNKLKKTSNPEVSRAVVE